VSDIDAAESADLVAAWRELLARHAATACALDRELGERFGLGMSEFEVLERLAEVPDGCTTQLRVQELGEKVHLSQSALSRLIGRLEKGGLVERHMCPEDRRGVFVLLSEAGRQRYQEAKPLHRAVLQRTLAVRQPSCG
jgi:DNA-binding MarR family transcriptional regulator